MEFYEIWSDNVQDVLVNMLTLEEAQKTIRGQKHWYIRPMDPQDVDMIQMGGYNDPLGIGSGIECAG